MWATIAAAKVNKGRKMPKDAIERTKTKQSGIDRVKNPTYAGIHKRARTRWKKTDSCEICNKDKKLDWANIDHTYKIKRSEWLCICRSCHIKLDRNLIHKLQ